MKKIGLSFTCLAIFLLSWVIGQSQDQMYLRDGSSLTVKVTEVNITDIRYQMIGGDGSLQSIEKAKVARIVYANGYEDVFPVPKPATEPAGEPSIPHEHAPSPVESAPSPWETTPNPAITPASSPPPGSTIPPKPSRSFYEQSALNLGGLVAELGVGGSMNVGLDPAHAGWTERLTAKEANSTANQTFRLQRRPLGGYQGALAIGYQTSKGLEITLGAGYGAQFWETRLREQFVDPEVQYDAFWDSAITVSQSQLQVPLTLGVPMGESFQLRVRLVGLYHLQTETYRRSQYFEVVNGERNRDATYHEISQQAIRRSPYWYPGAGIGIAYLSDAGVFVQVELNWQGASLLQEELAYQLLQARLGVGFRLAP